MRGQALEAPPEYDSTPDGTVAAMHLPSKMLLLVQSDGTSLYASSAYSLIIDDAKMHTKLKLPFS